MSGILATHGLVGGAGPTSDKLRHERGLLGTVSETALTIAPSKVYGLSIRLVETDAPGA